MAMPWFAHDTDCARNSKLKRVIRSHGMMGYGIWWRLLEELYAAEKNGFQIKADSMWLEDFAEDLRIDDYRVLLRVFDTFASLKLIDNQLWQKNIILADSDMSNQLLLPQ